MTIEPIYIGDGVYLKTDAWNRVVLTTGHHEDAHADNIIVLEPDVLAELMRVLEKSRA